MESKIVNELFVSNYLFTKLRGYGAIKWHKNQNHSFYIKFRDVRLGSIRIANHKGREKYHYTYELFIKDKDLERKIDDTIKSVKAKCKKILGFNGNRYIVFDKNTRSYKQVKNFNEYKNSIWGK